MDRPDHAGPPASPGGQTAVRISRRELLAWATIGGVRWVLKSVFVRFPHFVANIPAVKSALASRRRKAEPFRSAMSMLNFHINRSGRGLSAQRRDILERAKGELRRLFGREA